jgi:amino acid adenylation domain-containing protein
MPVGITGEIYIAGLGLARGYLNRADETADKFIANPFGEEGRRMYRTGDLGRYHNDGSIEHIGRVDDQVKIRGYRIELGEIEAALNEHFAVTQAIVLAREDEPGEKRLVGYVVCRQQVSNQELREYLQGRLPDYMAPGVIVQLEAMPLTPNGKLDRRALPKPELRGAGRLDVGPRTAVEEIVCGTLAEVLRIEKVGIHDNFFELGGHSLLATQVVSRVMSAMGVELSIRSLFTHPTAAAIAAEIEAQRRRAGEAPVEAITRVARDRELPLSYAQQRLWFINQLGPGSATYNIPGAVRLSGRLDVDALRKSFNEIIARHELLRTSFPSRDGEPRQQIKEVSDLQLERIDLRQADEAEQERKLQDVLRDEARRGFDLASGPLIRAKLIRMAKEEHVLIVNMHHIVSDGWSMGVIVREFAQLYEAFSQGQGSPLPEMEIQYADYAVWQREWLQGEALDVQLRYWKEKLDGMAMLEIPTDRAGLEVADYRRSSERIELSEELTRKLRKMSRREGVTLFMTLLAGFQSLLARYSGQEDIAVGTPIAGRNRREIEGLIGFFVNTLVMRVNVGDNPTVVELLRGVRETALGAYAHQDLPFEKLVEELQPERSLSRTPLFQVLIEMQNVPREELKISGLMIKSEPLELESAKFALTLTIVEGEGEISVEVKYATELYAGWRIKRLLEHLERVLGGMAEDEPGRVMELPMMSEQELRQIVVEWNQTSADYPRDRCVHELFEQQVELAPDAIAVVYEGEQLTYHQLNRRANQLGHYLREMGVGAEVKVGICVERSLDLIIGLLGVMKASGAYIPLDADYPQDRLAYMIEDSGCPVIMTTAQLLEELPVTLAQVVMIDDDWPAIARESDGNPGLITVAANLAYLMYTSGSAGKPKGVAVEHGNIVKLVRNVTYAELSPQEVFLQFAPVSFDASTFELWGCLLNGGRLVVCSSEFQSLEQLGRLLQEHQVTTAWFTAGLFQQVVDDRMEDLKNLRQILAGGESLSVPHVQKVLTELPDCRLINGYGPTECTTFSSSFRATEPGKLVSSVPIGHPISNSRIYILSQNQEPVPVGVRGEIYIAGQGLARSYANRADETADKFIADPFGEEGRRMYRTGDLGRYHIDGSIEYLGRRDEQVKIRGYRIELGEIEAVISEHPLVEQVIVLAREDEPGEKRLVGYVVGRRQISSQELKEYLLARLPDYMAPGAIVQLEAMPLTANGKLDRRALPKPELNGAGRLSVGPRTAVEEIVCGIWAEVLRVEHVGIHENFFELGGHSLLATQVVSRMRNLLGVEVSLHNLFTHPTVAAIAAEVEVEQRGGGQAPVEAIARVVRDRELPLSFAQQRLWFIDQLEPGSAAYNIPCALRLIGELDAEALCKSLNEIIARHEVLRTSFPTRDGEPRQEIHQFSHLQPGCLDLRQTDEAERRDELEEVLQAEARRGFDLSSGPLIRAKLIRLAEDEHVLVVTMHHIVSDGWSLGIIVRELSQLYEAFRQGQESPLPELEIQYADYAVWHRAWLRGEALENRLSYWRRQLGVRLPELEMPTDKPRPARQSYRGARRSHLLPTTLSDALKALSLEQNCTLFMTLLAAFKTILYYLTGQTDISVGTDIANRNRAETEKLIGFFVNQLVLRAELSRELTFEELLKKVRKITLEAYAHQDLPFEKLVEALNPDRDGNRTPLFQVKLLLQNAPGEELSLSGLTISPVTANAAAAKCDLELSLHDTAHGLNASLLYNTDLFEESTPARILKRFHTLLDRIVERPDARLEELVELLFEEDRREALEKEEQLESIRLGMLKGVKRKLLVKRSQRSSPER